MVEYGGGISHGPAGQVSGSHGGPAVGSSTDFFGNLGHAFNDVTAWVQAQPPEVLFVGFAVILLGLLILRRAF